MILLPLPAEYLLRKITEPLNAEGRVDVRYLDIIVRRVAPAPKGKYKINLC